MRIATWNVNSLKMRLDKVLGWIAVTQPDILLMQETKLSDDTVPELPFRMAGYDLVHHGEGGWNGVAIATRVGADEVITNFGDGPVRSGRTADDEPNREARMVSAVCGGIRVVSLYAPNGRVVDSSFYDAKLAWFDRLGRWLVESNDPARSIVVAGDLNVAPTDADVWDPLAAHGGTHVSGPEREAFRRLLDWGLVDGYRLHHDEPGRYTWWDYRAGHFHKGYGMRIDHLLVSRDLAARSTGAEIDRDARKNPTPSDHAPVWIDLADPT